MPLDDQDLKEQEEASGDSDSTGEDYGGKFDDERKVFEDAMGAPAAIDDKEAGDDKIPFRQEIRNKRQQLRDKRSAFFSKRKSKFLVFGLGGGGVLIIGGFIAIMLLFSSLKLVNLAEHITVYNMARSARHFRQGFARITEEQIATEVMEESTYSRLKTRYGESRVKAGIDKVNTYRPNKVFEQLESKTKPVYTEGAPRKFLPGNKKVFVGWDITDAKGHTTLIEKTNKRFFHPIQNYNEKLRFAAELDVHLERNYRGSNSLVRGKVMKKFLNERGIKLHWWEKKGKTFKGLRAQAAIAHEQKLSYEKRNPQTPRPNNCSNAKICSTANEAAKTADNTLIEAEKAGASNVDDLAAESAARTIDAGVTPSALENAVKFGSTLYAIAVPACLIYDGSLNKNSGSTIDDNETSYMKSYFSVQTAAHQQIAGDTTQEAVGALNNKTGNIYDSIPERRARGEAVDTVAETNAAALPQSSSTGSYGLFDVYLKEFIKNDQAVEMVKQITEKGCGFLTRLDVGIVLTLAELGVTLFSGGTSEVAEGAAKTGMRLAMERAAEKISSSAIKTALVQGGVRLAAKQVAKAGGKFALKTGIYVGGTVGMTELAKLAVLKHAPLDPGGLATGELSANQADIGGNIYGNRNEQQLLYGAPMTTPDVIEDKVATAAYLRQVNSAKPAFERYFAVSNPDSLFSKAGMGIYSSMSSKSFISNLFTSMLRSFSNMGSMFGFLKSEKVSAATVTGSGDYNLVQWGWTAGEEAIINNDENYSPLVNQFELEGSNQAEDIEKKYGHCFTDTMGTLLSQGHIRRNDDGSVIENDGKCSPKNLGLNSDDKDFSKGMIFRWRLAKRYDNTLDQLKALQSPTAPGSSGSASTAPDGAVSDIIAGDTSNLTCAAGTDAGIGDGYDNFKLYKIRLCNVKGIIVNAQIAANLDKMINAALGQGVILRGGGFRTMDQQKALRIKHGCPDPNASSSSCSPPTARPGNSNHQMGVAIDFSNCSSRGTTCYGWLKNNAATYGLKNLPSEPWHWSVDGN